MSTKPKKLTIEEVKAIKESLGDKKSREGIHGYDERKVVRESLKEGLEAAYETRKDLKARSKEETDAELKKKLNEDLRDLNKNIKEIGAAGREFGRVDSIAVMNGAVNIVISAAGGAVAAHVTDGDYVSRVVANTVGCVGVDAISSAATKYLTGIYGDEDWKRYAHKGVKFIFEVGGAAGGSAAVAHYGFGKDPSEAAITAALTQVAKRGLEWTRDTIMGW